jgi:putative acetyltransferase
MGCRVRPVHEDEMDLVRALFREYQAHIGVDLCFQSFEEELAGLPGRYGPPGGFILLAEEDGEAVGIVALRGLDADTAEMKRLYVPPARQGRGLGRELVARLLREARARGYAKLRLDTLPVMENAIAMYRRMGFREIAPYMANPVQGALFFELDLPES